MKTFGDAVNWVEPKGDYLSDYCVQCGKKTGKNALNVNVNTAGQVIDRNVKAPKSQGFWNIGRECAKEWNPAVFGKN